MNRLSANMEHWFLLGSDAPPLLPLLHEPPLTRIDSHTRELLGELQQREEFIQLIFRNINDGISLVRIDPVTKHRTLVACNRRYLELAGRNLEELLSSENLNHFVITRQSHPLDPNAEGITLREGEGSWIRPDGKENYVHWSSAPIEHNGELYFVGVDRDITERKRAEQRLESSRQRYQAVVETQTEMICRFQPNGIVTFANQAMARYLHRPVEELIGVDISDCIPSHGQTSIPDDLAELTPESPVCTRLYEIRGSTDTPRWQRWTHQALFDAKGHPREYQSVGRDVTEMQIAEERLQKSEAMLRLIADNATDLISLHTADGRYLYVSPACHRLLGYEPEELIGSDPYDLFDPEDIPRIRESHANILQSNGPYYITYRLLRKDGQYVHVESSSFQQWDEETQTASYIVSVTRDITQRVESQRQLMEYQQRLKRLTTQLSRAEDHTRRRIAQGLHDSVGQGLTAMQVSLGMLREDLADREDALREIDGMQRILKEVTHQVRNLTWELVPPTLYTLGLPQALEDLAERLETHAGLKVRVECHGPWDDIPEEILSPLFQVTRELLHNIVKHAGTDDANVRLTRRQIVLCISVEDQGRGFDPAQADCDAARNGAFGLFSARERITSMGGQLHIDAQPGKGTRVTLMVPWKGEHHHDTNSDGG